MRELSYISGLTCVVPMVSQSLRKTGALFILTKEFCYRGRDRKCFFDTILLSKKVSDQVSAISLTNVSSIFSLSISFLLRFFDFRQLLVIIERDFKLVIRREPHALCFDLFLLPLKFFFWAEFRLQFL